MGLSWAARTESRWAVPKAGGRRRFGQGEARHPAGVGAEAPDSPAEDRAKVVGDNPLEAPAVHKAVVGTGQAAAAGDNAEAADRKNRSPMPKARPSA